MLKVLLRHGADQTLRTVVGYTPLHEAAAAGKTDAMEILMQYSGRSTQDIGRDELLSQVRRLINKVQGRHETAIAAEKCEAVHEATTHSPSPTFD